jgi:hypothetical protein
MIQNHPGRLLSQVWLTLVPLFFQSPPQAIHACGGLFIFSVPASFSHSLPQKREILTAQL